MPDLPTHLARRSPPAHLSMRAGPGDAVDDDDEVLTHRLAREVDVPRLRGLAAESIAELQREFLRPDQIVASHSIMGIDTRLVADGTYFVVEDDGAIAGCGGWSRRATLYGGDHSAGRDDALLDPATEPARVRAMYTHPAWVRRGVGA